MTTIVSVRRNGHVVIAGDGQATLGNTVMKGNVKKVRRLYNDNTHESMTSKPVTHQAYLQYINADTFLHNLM